MKKARIVVVALAVLMLFAAVSCKEPHVHEFGDWEVTKPATCTEAGLETSTCKGEGCTETKTREIPALGHKFGNWTEKTAATCAVDGVDSRECATCHIVETKKGESALGHDLGVWVESETDGKVCRKCAVCKVEVEKKDGVLVSSEAELKAALSGAQEIVLGSDLKLKERVVLQDSTNCKTDLNGYKITLDADLLKESTEGSKGLICLYGDGCSLEIGDSSVAKTGLVDLVSGNDFDKPLIGYVFVVWPDNDEKASLTVNGGSYKALESAISGNGTFKTADCISITINDGEFEGDVAVYHPHNGSLVINGGKFVGSGSAVEIRAGKMSIKGGQFKAIATDYDVVSNGSGSTVTGAAIAVSQHSTKLPIDVSIEGGEFFGAKAVVKVNPESNSAEDFAKVKLSIIGGKFSTDPTEFVPADTHKVVEAESIWSVIAK